MDIFSHMLWSGALGRVAADKQPRVSVGWSAWWGIFPDLFAFLPAMAVGFWTAYQMNGSLSIARQSWQLDLAWDLYQISHSFVTFATVFIIILAARKIAKPRTSWKDILPYSLLGWPFHILLDIPTHRLGFFATPFLWPISDVRFPYGFSWGQPWFMTLNLVSLILMYVWLWKRKKSRSSLPSQLPSSSNA